MISLAAETSREDQLNGRLNNSHHPLSARRALNMESRVTAVQGLLNTIIKIEDDLEEHDDISESTS